jgi:hypothetical protein
MGYIIHLEIWNSNYKQRKNVNQINIFITNH